MATGESPATPEPAPPRDGASRRAAADDPYTTTVTVDATSDSVAKARDIARVDGARRALNTIIAALAGGADKVKPLKLSDNQVTDLVASFEVANEKMTAVRYTADYTYHFKPADVAKAMQGAGIAVSNNSPPNTGAPGAAPATGAASKPVVVLPIYQTGDTAVLWDDPNPWRDAWSQHTVGATGTSLLVPLGDVGDLAAIDADKARQGDATALAAIAKQENADDVMVIVATAQGGDKPGGNLGGLNVTARRYRAGKLVDVHADAIDPSPSGDDTDLFRRGVDTIAADIDNGWKNAKGDLSGGPPGSVEMVAPITGLDDWIKLRDSLAAMPSVRKIEVKSLSRQEATVDIQYVGGMDQLKANLAATKLDLQGGDPVWRLVRSAPDQH